MASSEKDKKTPSEPTPQIGVNAQYIKDLSFENPHSPHSLIGNQETPNVELSVNIDIHRLSKNNYEVCLHVQANASRNVTQDKKESKETVFLVDLHYAGVFTIAGEGKELEQLLMIYCPNLLFPFARSIIASTTRDGGFPPLMLEPVDFSQLYVKHKNEQSKKVEK